MARPKGVWTPDIVRRRIQATKLAKALQDHVFGKNEMSATQIRAAEILLRKKVPDLNTTEFTGELTHREITDQPQTAEQWENQYADRLETPGGSSEGTH
jgi:hypothetical protein